MVCTRSYCQQYLKLLTTTHITSTAHHLKILCYPYPFLIGYVEKSTCMSEMGISSSVLPFPYHNGNLLPLCWIVSMKILFPEVPRLTNPLGAFWADVHLGNISLKVTSEVLEALETNQWWGWGEEGGGGGEIADGITRSKAERMEIIK